MSRHTATALLLMLMWPVAALAADQKIYDDDELVCFGTPFAASKSSNYCIARLGAFGTPAIAVGSTWGHLSVFFYVGTVSYRGGGTDACEIQIGGSTAKGTHVISESMKAYGNYTSPNGMVEPDDSTYCVFYGAAAETVLDGIWKSNDAVIRLTSRPNDVLNVRAADWNRAGLNNIYEKSLEYTDVSPSYLLKAPENRSIIDRLLNLVP